MVTRTENLAAGTAASWQGISSLSGGSFWGGGCLFLINFLILIG